MNFLVLQISIYHHQCSSTDLIRAGKNTKAKKGTVQKQQELSHDSIARLNCALPITKTISVIR